MYVREMDLFVKVLLLEDTPAVLLLEKLCEHHGYNYHWTSGQKQHLIKNGREVECNTASYVLFVVLGLSTSSSSSHSRTSPASSSKEAVTLTELPHQQEVKVCVRKYEETRRVDHQKPITK